MLAVSLFVLFTLFGSFSQKAMADDCTSGGLCCAHWSATGECLHEYQCGGSCRDEDRDSNNRLCCAHRSATGECLHEYVCKSVESKEEALKEAEYALLDILKK